MPISILTALQAQPLFWRVFRHPSKQAYSFLSANWCFLSAHSFLKYEDGSLAVAPKLIALCYRAHQQGRSQRPKGNQFCIAGQR